MDVSRRAIHYMSKPVRIIILLLVFLVQSIPYYSTLYLKEQYHNDGGRSPYAKPTFEYHICGELYRRHRLRAFHKRKRVYITGSTLVIETVGYRLFGFGLFSVITLISLWLALYLSIHYHDLFLYIFFGILSILDVTG
jgi:hypothetical protein